MSIEQEKRIREARTIEAVKKDLMGLGGKIGIVMKIFGTPILKQIGGESLHNASYLPDFYNEIVEEPSNSTELQNSFPFYGDPGNQPVGGGFREEREFSPNYSTSDEIGYMFDGLSRGVHIEMSYLKDGNEIKVSFQGRQVYLEAAGELQSYIPGDDWESKVENLYIQAKKIEKTIKKEVKKQQEEEVVKNKATWLQNMKKLWGI